MYALIPILACVYATIVFPLIIVSLRPERLGLPAGSPPREQDLLAAACRDLASIWALRNYSRLRFPPHIIWLFAYLAFAGAERPWAFKPEISFVRYAQQAMIVISIVVPAMLAARNADLMRGLFICFAIAAVLNLVASCSAGRRSTIKFATWGYPGYFSGKNYLGRVCAPSRCCWRFMKRFIRASARVFGIVIAIIAVALLILSNSKTSIGLAVLAPLLAGATLCSSGKRRAFRRRSSCCRSRSAVTSSCHHDRLQHLSPVIHAVRRSDVHRPLDHLGFRRSRDRRIGRCSDGDTNPSGWSDPMRPASSMRRAG